jgi:hypothetical protein
VELTQFFVEHVVQYQSVTQPYRHVIPAGVQSAATKGSDDLRGLLLCEVFGELAVIGHVVPQADGVVC